MLAAFAWLLAFSTVAIRPDAAPLRAACDDDAAVVAELKAGDPVEIRFAMAGDNGACYKVSASSGGKLVEGYVTADALAGLEEFERGRRGAPSIDVPKLWRAELEGRSGNEPAVAAVRLLEANQPRQSLEILAPALRASPGDPSLLSLAGLAAYRSDDIPAALGYWRDSLQLRPNPAIERLYRIAEREAQADKSTEKIFGMRFVLRYDRGSVGADQARQMVAVLDQEFNRISAQLGCTAQERITAIVQDVDAYRRSTDAAEWSGGQYDGRIRVALSSGRLDTEARRAFAHEIVHACLSELGRWPAWLQEGLAQKLSGDTLDARQRKNLLAQARAGGLPRLDRLSQSWSRLSSRHAALAYGVSLAAVELFYEHHSQLGARNLLSNPRMLPQITRDLDRLLRE